VSPPFWTAMSLLKQEGQTWAMHRCLLMQSGQGRAGKGRAGQDRALNSRRPLISARMMGTQPNSVHNQPYARFDPTLSLTPPHPDYSTQFPPDLTLTLNITPTAILAQPTQNITRTNLCIHPNLMLSVLNFDDPSLCLRICMRIHSQNQRL